MEIILLDSIENLGGLGDRVKVRPGYARNYLFPTGKAKFATAENIAAFEARRAELEKTAQDTQAQAEARRERLEGQAVTIPAKAGAEGKLFGSIGPADIALAMQAAGVEVEKREVLLPRGTLRQTGDYEVDLHLYTNVTATIKVSVVPEA
ncbi:MAG: 50S ribosomal protein L9 [Gammaproteobacteria bacterium]|nr:50S ribosomal protein L9 [Gammaproteobacteria bacterium]